MVFVIRAGDVDSAYSLIAASGNLGTAYAAFRSPDQPPPYRVWVSASQWRSLVRPAQVFCFQRITDDVAGLDNHPPLFYHLLHLWILAFGASPAAGVGLNLLFDTMGFLAAFALALRVFGSRQKAALAALLWFLSPAVLIVSAHVRMYCLLATLAMLFSERFLAAMTEVRPRAGHLAGLALFAFLGIATHYHFVLVIVGALAYLTMHTRKDGLERLSRIGLALVPAAVAFLLYNPWFFVAVSRTQGQLDMLSSEEAIRRMVIAILTPSRFFWYLGPAVVHAAIGVCILTAGVIYLIRVCRNCRRVSSVQILGAFPLFLASWLLTSIVGLYVLCLSPSWAMKQTYLSLVWPFFACAVAVAVGSRPWVSLALCAMMVLSSVEAGWRLVHPQLQAGEGYAKYQRVLLDNTRPDHIVRMLPVLSETASVFVVDRPKLAANLGAIRRDAGQPILYLAEISISGGEADLPRAILDLERQFHVRLLREDGYFGIVAYELAPHPVSGERLRAQTPSRPIRSGATESE